MGLPARAAMRYRRVIIRHRTGENRMKRKIIAAVITGAALLGGAAAAAAPAVASGTTASAPATHYNW